MQPVQNSHQHPCQPEAYTSSESSTGTYCTTGRKSIRDHPCYLCGGTSSSDSYHLVELLDRISRVPKGGFGSFGLCFGITCCASRREVTLLVLFCAIGTRPSSTLTRHAWFISRSVLSPPFQVLRRVASLSGSGTRKQRLGIFSRFPYLRTYPGTNLNATRTRGASYCVSVDEQEVR
jgi:hypothetical protein